MNHGPAWFFGYLRTACLMAKEFVYLASVWHVLVLLEDCLIGPTRPSEALVICRYQAYIMAATMVALSIYALSMGRTWILREGWSLKEWLNRLVPP